jgi:isoleucyl-tRNA synthetase
MEEVWQTRYPDENDSIHLQQFYSLDGIVPWEEGLTDKMKVIQDFRSSVSEVIEPLRKDNVIAPEDSKLTAALSALGVTRKDEYANPAEPNDTLADYLIVSECDLSTKASAISAEPLSENNAYKKCERSWKYFKGEGDITPRDAAAVAAFDSK